MTFLTRTAPAGAQYSRPTLERMATIDALVQQGRTLDARTRAAMVGNGARPRMQEPATLPEPDPGDPMIEARLNEHDTTLGDHEARLSKLESLSGPAPAAPDSTAAAQSGTTTALDAGAILARHNAHYTARAAAMKVGGTARPQSGPSVSPRIAPPASCTAIDTRDIYARLGDGRKKIR